MRNQVTAKAVPGVVVRVKMYDTDILFSVDIRYRRNIGILQ